jgi:transmembrane sensor
MANRTQQLENLHALQASTWVETMRDPSPKDQAAFVAWLKESPRNVRDFLLMLSVDRALDDLDAERLHDVEALVASVDRRVTPIFRRPTPAEIMSPRHWRRPWVAVAASALTAVIGGWFIWGPGAADWRTITTATGEQRAFELEDGSVINLNTHSRVAIRFGHDARDVRLLEGEALFNVHHDSARPFRVYTHDAVVQAVGTQFNVYQRAQDTVVSVIAGRVSVAAEPEEHPHFSMLSHLRPTAPSNAATLQTASVHSVGPSEEAQISSAGSVSVRSLPDVTEAVAWRDRRLIFRKQTLEHIVEEFNRYSLRQIRLQGADVENRVYTGVFDVDDTESLEQVLAHDADLIADQSDAGIVIRHR